MSRGMLAWTLLSLVVMAAGCRMCASPYDDCSPTFTGLCGEDCAPMARAGSVLSGYFPSMYPEQFPADQVPDLPDLPDDQMLPPEVARSPVNDSRLLTEGQLASVPKLVTDSELDEAPPEETVVVDEARPAQTQGWTSAKPAKTRIE